MSFTDHKITQFQHKIADLADQPTLPPDELKARFDACPEELRQSLNAVCDDAARLEARVEGIVVDTFGDTIDKEMLSDELAAELDSKAEAADLNAEIAARTALGETVALKCECYFGTYEGSGAAERTIELGFAPKAVFLFTSNGTTRNDNYSYGGLALQQAPILVRPNKPLLEIQENGFTVYQEVYFNQAYVYIYGNNEGTTYHYLAFR